jgi:hypothetical protein
VRARARRAAFCGVRLKRADRVARTGRRASRARAGEMAEEVEDDVGADDARDAAAETSGSDGDEDGFGAFATPMTTMKGARLDEETSEASEASEEAFGTFETPETSMKATPAVERGMESAREREGRRVCAGGELDLIASAPGAEFENAAKRLLSGGTDVVSAMSEDADEDLQRFIDGLGSGSTFERTKEVAAGRFTTQAWEAFRERVRTEREAVVEEEIEDINIPESEASESHVDEESEKVEINDENGTSSVPQTAVEFDLISLEPTSSEKAPTSVVDPFANFGDVVVESTMPQTSREDDVEDVPLEDDDFGDFV